MAAVLTLTGTYYDLLTLIAFVLAALQHPDRGRPLRPAPREPDLPRPYRALGYPVLPGLYVLVSVFFLFFILKGDPKNSGLGLLLTAAGVPAFLYWRRGAAAPASNR